MDRSYYSGLSTENDVCQSALQSRWAYIRTCVTQVSASTQRS